MAGRDDRAVREKWIRLTSRLQSEPLGSAGLPLETEADCFPQIGPDACVVRAIKVVNSPQDFVCTHEQAEELEGIWNKAMAGRSKSSASADTALLERLNSMRGDLKRSLPKEACAAP
jgi:hypothetical protein